MVRLKVTKGVDEYDNYNRFNSKMVRLKDYFLGMKEIAKESFNSKMVRLKGVFFTHTSKDASSFNSKMVRLKVFY